MEYHESGVHVAVPSLDKSRAKIFHLSECLIRRQVVFGSDKYNPQRTRLKGEVKFNLLCQTQPLKIWRL